MAVQFVSGSSDLAALTATATADTSKPNVYLNTTETTAGATVMTVTAWAATSCTFTDPPGAPIGSLKLGLENTRNLSIEWVDVTVDPPQLAVASGTPSIAEITSTSLTNVFSGVEATPSVPEITSTSLVLASPGTPPVVPSVGAPSITAITSSGTAIIVHLASGTPSLTALTASSTALLRHTVTATVDIPEITSTSLVTIGGIRAAIGSPSIEAITASSATTATSAPVVPTDVDNFVLLQDHSAGFAKITLQSDIASSLLLQKTFAESELLLVAPEATKDYYLQQEPDTSLFVFEDGMGFVLLEESSDMSDQIEVQLPQSVIYEESSLTATAYFRSRDAKTSAVPTTIHYRLDCLTTHQEITNWTSVSTPGTSNDITLSPAQNQILNDSSAFELKQLTIKIDNGLSSQYIKPIMYRVKNLQGIV